MVSKYFVCLKKDNPAVILEKKNCFQKLENKLWLFHLFVLLFYFIFLVFHSFEAEVLISKTVSHMSVGIT